jgi:hypothetical protein
VHDKTPDHFRPPVLVGEPDAVLRRAIVRALTRGPDRVGLIVEADTLAEAERCVTSIPRLAGALVEASFPDGSSVKLLDRLRDRHGRCPALVTSRSSSARDRSWVFERGAAFLSKPGLAGIPLRRFARDCLKRFDDFERAFRKAALRRFEMREGDATVLSGLLAGWSRRAFEAQGVSMQSYISFTARFRRATGITVRELRRAPLEVLVTRLEG